MRNNRRSSRYALALAIPVVLTLAACSAQGQADSTDEPDQGPKIAFFMVARSNTWASAALEGAQEVAAENGGEVVPFDGAFDPSAQSAQIQDAIASGQYDGFLVMAADGVAVAPDVEAAVAAGIKVASITGPVGPDVSSGEVQIEGQTFAIMTPAPLLGEQVGRATVEACADVDPCEVAFLRGDPASAFDAVKRDAFMEVVGAEDNIDVVADTFGGYLADPSRQAIQDILQVHPDLAAVATIGDQMADGALQAAQAENKQIAVIGQGASKIGVERVRSGEWFASVIGLPRTEGVLAVEALVGAINGENPNPDYVDPVAEAGYGDGLLTAQFLEEHPEFEPEWAG